MGHASAQAQAEPGMPALLARVRAGGVDEVRATPDGARVCLSAVYRGLTGARPGTGTLARLLEGRPDLAARCSTYRFSVAGPPAVVCDRGTVVAVAELIGPMAERLTPGSRPPRAAS